MMENFNEERFEKGMRDLKKLRDVLEKVYFGSAEYYLEEMIRRYKDGEFGKLPDETECSNYKNTLDSFRDFKPILQQFVLSLSRLPNFR